MRMRSAFFLSLLGLFGLYGSVSAQLFVGLRGGMYVGGFFPHRSTNFLSNIQNSTQLGYVVGIPFNLKLNNFLSLQPELNYLNKRGLITVTTYAGNNGTYLETRKATLNYLEVPLLLRLAVGGKAFRLYTLLGPNVAILSGGADGQTLYHKASLASNYTKLIDFSNDKNAPSRYASVDVGMNLGAGVSFKAGSGYLSMELRYLPGFLRANRSNTPALYNVSMMGATASLSYMFKLISKKEK